MSIPKFLLIAALILFAVIGGIALFKKEGSDPVVTSQAPLKVVETAVLTVPSNVTPPTQSTPPPVGAVLQADFAAAGRIPSETANPRLSVVAAKDDFPIIDRVFQLFSIGNSKLPIVETITYSSAVSWLKGRPAWIADYASHYNTSRHFIARSLNGKPDYFTQKVFEGSQFNVFRADKKIQFYLLCDLSRLKMGFYYVDLDTNERVLLKTYSVSLGKLDSTKPSSSLTPLGRYALGDRVAVYKPGMLGYVGDQQSEMVRVFGTRWIPFAREVDRTTAPAKGHGLYGVPWGVDAQTGNLVECRQVIGQYNTDGGIRMLSEDIEEVFAIVVSKPAFIEIVKDFKEAKLPGHEVAAPTR